MAELTDLQFDVIDLMLDGEQSGLELRDALAAKGTKRSIPAFVELMGRLEDARFVSGRYAVVTVGKDTYRQRVYRVLANGRRAFDSKQEFYAVRAGARLGDA